MSSRDDGAELHRRAREVFLEATRRTPNELPAFLDLACSHDLTLRREVEALLSYDGEEGSGVLDAPALGRDFRLPPPEDLVEEPSPLEATLPGRIGRYSVIDLLGRGATGTVYRAEQEHTHRIVALKVLREDAGNARALERFELEVEVLGLLKHPGIAQIYEAGTLDLGAGVQTFFAMELVEGRTITDHAQAERLGPREALALVGRAAEAVHHAHQRGIVHRDLKPDNVLVDASGQPKILDFGVAHLVGERGPSQGGDPQRGLVGTPAYMSPEQVTGGSGPLDTRSDTYSLGVIAYQLLAGELPYPVEGATLTEVADRIRFHQPRPLGEHAPVLRGDIEAIVARALAKDRERRYPSAADLAADVRRYLDDEPVSARRLTVGYQLAKFARRNRALSGTFLALVLVLLASATLSTWLALRARSNAESAMALNDLLIGVLSAPMSGASGEGLGVTVMEVLERSEESMHAQLADWPGLEARLGLALGRLYRNVGDFAGAERNLSQALALYSRAMGESHPMTLDAARALLSVRVLHGEDPGQVDDLLHRLLEQDEAVWGRDSVQALETRYLQGLHQRRTGDLEEAVVTLRAVVAAGAREQGPDSRFVHQVSMFLARALNESGRVGEARGLAEDLLELRTALFGPDNRGTLISMVTLGEVLMGRDGATPAPEDLERARGIFEDVVAARQRVLGTDHPGTLNARVQLARTRFRQGARAEGIAGLESVVADFDRLYPPTQPEAHEARTHLLDLYRQEGRVRDAEDLARELEAHAPSLSRR
jgi:tetratricopeptide (TPR) repeat protein